MSLSSVGHNLANAARVIIQPIIRGWNRVVEMVKKPPEELRVDVSGGDPVNEGHATIIHLTERDLSAETGELRVGVSGDLVMEDYSGVDEAQMIATQASAKAAKAIKDDCYLRLLSNLETKRTAEMKEREGKDDFSEQEIIDLKKRASEKADAAISAQIEQGRSLGREDVVRILEDALFDALLEMTQNANLTQHQKTTARELFKERCEGNRATRAQRPEWNAPELLSLPEIQDYMDEQNMSLLLGKITHPVMKDAREVEAIECPAIIGGQNGMILQYVQSIHTARAEDPDVKDIDAKLEPVLRKALGAEMGKTEKGLGMTDEQLKLMAGKLQLMTDEQFAVLADLYTEIYNSVETHTEEEILFLEELTKNALGRALIKVKDDLLSKLETKREGEAGEDFEDSVIEGIKKRASEKAEAKIRARTEEGITLSRENIIVIVGEALFEEMLELPRNKGLTEFQKKNVWADFRRVVQNGQQNRRRNPKSVSSDLQSIPKMQDRIDGCNTSALLERALYPSMRDVSKEQDLRERSVIETNQNGMAMHYVGQIRAARAEDPEVKGIDAKLGPVLMEALSAEMARTGDAVEMTDVQFVVLADLYTEIYKSAETHTVEETLFLEKLTKNALGKLEANPVFTMQYVMRLRNEGVSDTEIVKRLGPSLTKALEAEMEKAGDSRQMKAGQFVAFANLYTDVYEGSESHTADPTFLDKLNAGVLKRLEENPVFMLQYVQRLRNEGMSDTDVAEKMGPSFMKVLGDEMKRAKLDRKIENSLFKNLGHLYFDIYEGKGGFDTSTPGENAFWHKLMEGMRKRIMEPTEL